MTKQQSKNSPIGIDEILAKEIREEPPILINGILPAGGGMILAGESEVGKSMMRVEWSILLACGLPIYGMRTPNAQTVLVFQTENTMKQEQFRTKRIMQGYGIESVHNRIHYAHPKRKPSLRNSAFLDHAEEQIKACGATVVWYDPLVSFHSENENDNVRVRRVLDGITYLNRKTGAASIVIHHFGQPGKAGEEIPLRYRMRGASSIRDWADTIVTLRHIRKGDNPGHGRVLDFIKIRNGPQRSPYYLHRNKYFIHEVADENRRVPMQLVKQVVRRHGKECGSQNDLIARIRERTECGRRCAFDAIKEAQNLGYIWVQKVDGINEYRAQK